MQFFGNAARRGRTDGKGRAKNGFIGSSFGPPRSAGGIPDRTHSGFSGYVVRPAGMCQHTPEKLQIPCPRASALGHGATAQGRYGISPRMGGRQRTRTARGRLGPWGRHRCSVMLPIVGPCSAPHATSRPASLLQRFADLEVACSSHAGRASNNETPREVALGAFSFGRGLGPNCSHDAANPAPLLCERTAVGLVRSCSLSCSLRDDRQLSPRLDPGPEVDFVRPRGARLAV